MRIWSIKSEAAVNKAGLDKPRLIQFHLSDLLSGPKQVAVTMDVGGEDMQR